MPTLPKVNLVRVIHDTRDARRDIYIPWDEAEALFKQGKLIQVNVYNNQWDYGIPWAITSRTI